MFPLDRSKVLAWSVQRTVVESDILYDFEKIKELLGSVTSGNEAAVYNEIFSVVTKRAPIWRVLYDRTQALASEYCPTCNRKAKKNRPLAILHDGCILSAPEMVAKLRAAEDAKQTKQREKEEKTQKKQQKEKDVKAAVEEPCSNIWNPCNLTVPQLKNVLEKRKISFSSQAKKADLVAAVVKSNENFLANRGSTLGIHQAAVTSLLTMFSLFSVFFLLFGF